MNIGKLLLNIVSIFLKPFVSNFEKEIDKNKNVEKTVSLYPQDRFTKIRFWDTPFIEVEKMVIKSGTITDLGCGEGIFTNLLALSSSERKITGIEIDQERFKKADRGLKNVSFKKGDATELNIPKSDNIILFHLLHHLPSYKDQEKVIKNCVNSLNKNGKLIIVEVDIKFSFKYLTSLFVDCFLVPWIFEKRFFTSVFYRSKNDWLKLFNQLNLKCKTTNLEKGKPFTHVVFEVQ